MDYRAKVAVLHEPRLETPADIRTSYRVHRKSRQIAGWDRDTIRGCIYSWSVEALATQYRQKVGRQGHLWKNTKLGPHPAMQKEVDGRRGIQVEAWEDADWCIIR